MSPDSSSASLSAETPVPSSGKKKKRKGTVSLSNIAKLVDNKRRHMEKTLSQAQQEQLLMNTIKQDFLMKKERKEVISRSKQDMEESISKMTMCVTSLGDVIASGMQMFNMHV